MTKLVNKQENQVWTIKKVLLWTSSYFREKGIESPKFNSECILAKVLNKTRLDLYLGFDMPLTSHELSEAKQLIKKRANFYPLQYLLGETEFYGHKFIVNESVFIPRPETELLLDEVIEHIEKSDRTEWKILEIGTGTGIIPISLYKHFQNSPITVSITATDISKDVPENFKANLNLHKINNIDFIPSDLFQNIFDKFDIIISNPPYISPEDIENLQNEVKDYEPRIALNGGKMGLEIYSGILNDASKFLNKSGTIFFEIGANQKNDILKIAIETNFKITRTKQDFNELDRVLTIKKG
ncbi:MAG: peptide chain release factor N(5)-glutamine methyltransferase [Candidatus Cloacimonadota bacterium]|nr:peptide chain release factor N(5)-glutamine methyltransferase [Candidatus Cloacimonadota bacterium]